MWKLDKRRRSFFLMAIIVLLVLIVGVEEIFDSSAGVRIVIELVLVTGVGTILYFWFQEHADLLDQLLVTERHLRRSREQYKIIIENAEELISLLDSEGRYVYVSPSYAQLGWVPKKLIGKLAISLIHPDDRKDFEKSLGRAGEGKVVTGRYRIKKKSSGYLLIEVKRRGIRDETGEVSTMVSIARDVGRQVETEHRRDDFISVASHELRTPVTSLGLYAEVLAKRLAKTGDQESIDLVKKVNHQLVRLMALVQDLLDVSRIESGKLKLELELVNIDKLLGRIVDEVGVTCETHKIKVVGKCKKEVLADRQRIGQVIRNLLTNAVKYSPQAKRVDVKIGRRGARVIISVSDYGIGISKEGIGRIFERHYRDERAQATNISGLGMGLYISAQIVAKHRGKLTVKSREGKGSTFTLELPVIG